MARFRLGQFFTSKIKTSMLYVLRLLRQSLRHMCQQVQTRFQKKDDVLHEARAALQECKDMYQLLDLLFSTDFHRDEAFLELFQQRIQEIDDAH
jgi:hypothetical protein